MSKVIILNYEQVMWRDWNSNPDCTGFKPDASTSLGYRAMLCISARSRTEKTFGFEPNDFTNLPTEI